MKTKPLNHWFVQARNWARGQVIHSLSQPLTTLLLALMALSYSSQAATESTNAVAVVRKSLFQDDLKSGKDPFFPRSTRRGPKTPELTAVATPLVNLVLKGITGPPKRRFALINNQTLSAGETASVRVANGQIKVHCLEIRDDSVLISVEGNPEQKELRLRGQ